MTSGMIYWITRLDNIRDFVIVVCVITSIGTLISFISYYVNKFDDGMEAVKAVSIFKKLGLTLLTPLLISVLILVFMPTIREMVTIYVLPKIANSEIVKELPEDYKMLKDLAFDYLNKQMKDK